MNVGHTPVVVTLGEPLIRIEDEVANLGNTTVPHNWLYHINFGYPLVDRDSHPLAAQWLDPGKSRKYNVGIQVHDQAGVEQLLARDLPLVPGPA